jgi:hypothetical protein
MWPQWLQVSQDITTAIEKAWIRHTIFRTQIHLRPWGGGWVCLHQTLLSRLRFQNKCDFAADLLIVYERGICPLVSNSQQAARVSFKLNEVLFQVRALCPMNPSHTSEHSDPAVLSLKKAAMPAQVRIRIAHSQNNRGL